MEQPLERDGESLILIVGTSTQTLGSLHGTSLVEALYVCDLIFLQC